MSDAPEACRHYDPDTDSWTIYGTRYSGQLLRALGQEGPEPGPWLRVIYRHEDEQLVTVQTLHEYETADPARELLELLEEIFNTPGNSGLAHPRKDTSRERALRAIRDSLTAAAELERKDP